MNYQENNVVNVYNQIAIHFNETRVNKWPWITEFLNTFNNYIPLIYDFGCGNGRNMNYPSIKFIGIDNSKEFIKICRNKKLHVIESNIIKTPLPSVSADAIICIATFHHLDNYENRKKALLEMYRVLKDDGIILLSVWSINQPPKTKRNFNQYGDNIVLWNNCGKIYERYYYIFNIDELKLLFLHANLCVDKYIYDCGNEIFYLKKITNK
jgi:SAM-dependent methyltransferase